MKAKQDIWTNGESSVRVFRTTVAVGSRHSLLAPSSVYATTYAVRGVNHFATRADCHKHLVNNGYRAAA